MSDPKSKLETLTFEQALGELEAIVEQLERGNVSLDTAIDAYARGMSLKAHCQARLEEARLVLPAEPPHAAGRVWSCGGAAGAAHGGVARAPR